MLAATTNVFPSSSSSVDVTDEARLAVTPPPQITGSCTKLHSHPDPVVPSNDPTNQFLGVPGKNSVTSLPVKRILTKGDLEKFLLSNTNLQVLGFLGSLNDAVKNKENQHELDLSPNVMKVLDMLAELKTLVNDHPPATQASRFGNIAFRNWFDGVKLKLIQIHKDWIPSPFAEEVTHYLLHSFGDRMRIDFGTGHELNFLCYLFCLDKLSVVCGYDYDALVLKVFVSYMNIMRLLQSTYWLEPAGSHGVWGLDDYHFLPFYFGSAQLYDHPYIRPRDIHSTATFNDFLDNFLYFQSVNWILTSKNAPGLTSGPSSLRWHSPMLDDITCVKTWRKVNEGLLKMYKAEVMGKLPIMQHFLFGSLIPLTFVPEEEFPSEDNGHVHAFGQEKPTCCNMRLPSRFAGVGQVTAKGTARHAVGGGFVAETGSLRGGRVIPFD